jgi:hypothetical protein
MQVKGRVDRQTDMMELIVSLRNFVNTPKLIELELYKILLLLIHKSWLLCYHSSYIYAKALLHW